MILNTMLATFAHAHMMMYGQPHLSRAFCKARWTATAAAAANPMPMPTPTTDVAVAAVAAAAATWGPRFRQNGAVAGDVISALAPCLR